MANPLHADIQNFQLLRRLQGFRGPNTILAATTSQAVNVAEFLGSKLDLPHYAHYCKAITHPGNVHKTIGSVTSREIILNDEHVTLPQGYIEHQIALLKHLLRREDHEHRPEIKDRLVILIREAVEGSDQVSAVVEELKKANARAVILATPLVHRRAIAQLEMLVDELIFGIVDSGNLPLRGAVREKPPSGHSDLRTRRVRLEYVH